MVIGWSLSSHSDTNTRLQGHYSFRTHFNFSTILFDLVERASAEGIGANDTRLPALALIPPRVFRHCGRLPAPLVSSRAGKSVAL